MRTYELFCETAKAFLPLHRVPHKLFDAEEEPASHWPVFTNRALTEDTAHDLAATMTACSLK